MAQHAARQTYCLTDAGWGGAVRRVRHQGSIIGKAHPTPLHSVVAVTLSRKPSHPGVAPHPAAPSAPSARCWPRRASLMAPGG